MPWDWNDVRHFLAVARTGTTSAAARALGANQTTVARRIAALEAAFEMPLFERTPMGYALTEAGKVLVPLAETVDGATAAFEAEALERSRATRSIIRVTTSDILAETIMVPAITAFKAVEPDIHVSLDVDRRLLDLVRGEADVALRPAQAHDDPALIVRKVMDDSWAIYAAKSYPNPPETILAALAHPFATMSGKPREILMHAPVKIEIRYSMNTMPGLADTLANGDCIGGMPCFAGDRDARLRRCCAVPFETGGIWIVYPERLRGRPHIRAFVDHLTAFVAARASG